MENLDEDFDDDDIRKSNAYVENSFVVKVNNITGNTGNFYFSVNVEDEECNIVYDTLEGRKSLMFIDMNDVPKFIEGLKLVESEFYARRCKS